MAPLKPTGFWSYTSADDAASDGRLSRLRTQLAKRLGAQLGQPVYLFQDKAAIPPGTPWGLEIESALAKSSFFIPIVTPGFLQSEWCAREVWRFRDHMKARGRDDLILPVHYLDVTRFQADRREDCFDPNVFDYLKSLQWMDFRKLEQQDSDTADVRIWLAGFAERIEEALYRPVPPAPPIVVARKLQEVSDAEWINFQMAPPAKQAEHVAARTPALPPPAARKRSWPIFGAATAIAVLCVFLGIRQVLSPGKDLVPSPAVTSAPPAAVPPPDQPAPVAASAPPKAFQDSCPATAICPEMVLIPHGSFQIGTTDEELEREKVPEMFRDYEKPRHTVTIGADFYLGKYDVTVGEFKAFVRATGPRPAGGCENWEKGSDGQYGWQFKQDRTWDRPGFPQTDRDPVVCVSYDDAVAYIGWLNASAGTKAYRLPGEAEWEYAARANTTTARFWGDGRDAACRFANVADLSLAKHDGIATPNQERYFNCTDGFVFTAPAGSFLSNDFGLYDMLGNVWQWTADCWNDDLTNIPPNGTTRSTGGCGLRVVRGGSWNSNPRYVRAGYRSWDSTGGRFTNTGFRVARTL